MAQKKKGPKSSMSSKAPSENQSVVSDLSYQSDLSQAVSQNAFITAQPRKRPRSPARPKFVPPPLEEIGEETRKGRCKSPTVRDWDPIRMTATVDEYSDRLSAYLEEIQEQLDYMEGFEEMIKDNVDIKAID